MPAVCYSIPTKGSLVFTSSQANSYFKVSLAGGPGTDSRRASNKVVATINTVEDKQLSYEDFVIFAKDTRPMTDNPWIRVIEGDIESFSSTVGAEYRNTVEFTLTQPNDQSTDAKYALWIPYDILVIRRESALFQSFRDGQLNGLELQLDKIVEFAQDNARDLESSVKFIDQETGGPAGGYVVPTPNSVLHFDSKGKPEALHIGENDNITLREDLGKKPMDDSRNAFRRILDNDVQTENNRKAILVEKGRVDGVEIEIGKTSTPPAASLKGRIKNAEENISELEREFSSDSGSIADLGNRIGDPGDDSGGSGSALARIKKLRERFDDSGDGTLNNFIVPLKLYRSFTKTQIANRDVASAELHIDNSGQGPVSAIVYSHTGNSITFRPNGSHEFIYLSPKDLDSEFAKSDSVVYVLDIIVEFNEHGTDPTLLSGQAISWATRTYPHPLDNDAEIKDIWNNIGSTSDISDPHPGGRIYQRIQHNFVQTIENAEKISELEERPSGGSGVPYLEILAVNDGVTLFDSIETVPNVLLVQYRNASGVEIAGIRATVTAEGTNFGSVTFGDTENGTFRATSGRIARTSAPFFLKIPVRGTTALNNSFRNIATNRGGRSATFEIFDTSDNRIGTFSLTVGKTLEDMLGAVNLNDILTRGLPSLLPNIIQTVLANLTPSFRFVHVLGGSGNPSVPLSITMTSDNFEEYKKATHMALILGPQTSSVSGRALTATSAEYINISLATMDRSTGVLYYRMSFQRSGNLSTAYVQIVILSTRSVQITSSGLGTSVGPHILQMSVHIPSYSFTPSRGQSIPGYTAP